MPLHADMIPALRQLVVAPHMLRQPPQQPRSLPFNCRPPPPALDGQAQNARSSINPTPARRRAYISYLSRLRSRRLRWLWLNASLRRGQSGAVTLILINRPIDYGSESLTWSDSISPGRPGPGGRSAHPMKEFSVM